MPSYPKQDLPASGSANLRGGYEKKNRDAPTDTHALSLPQSADAEKGVLSAILQSPGDLIGTAVITLKAEAFYVPANRMLYELLIELDQEGKPCDTISLIEALNKRKLIDKVGGVETVMDLYTAPADAAHFEFWAQIINEKFLLREIINTCTNCITEAYDNEETPDQLLDAVEQHILDIGDGMREDKRELTMREHVMKAVESIEDAYANKGVVQGITTGLKDLDRMTNGMHAGEMIIIAARPSMGKTSLAMNIAEHVACDIENGKDADGNDLPPGLGVAVFSLEMTTGDLVGRLLVSRAKADAQKIRSGMPDKRDFPKLIAAADELSRAKMYIDETPGISILELRAKSRRLKQKHDIQLIVVDYLQLMKSNSKRGQDNRQLEIAEISAGLKALAKELSIPILVLAQLNRNPEGRGGGRPRVSDLRESGSIEQDADVVALLMRPERYADEEDERDELEGEATLIIAKQRNGPTGDLPLTFIGNQLRFADRAFEPDD
ncbi:MAG: replicative DNA helicase [Verrucomicrobiales bacterium]|jgi:replicative DNA helicase